MNARKPLMSNVAVIGFGYWGKNLIRNFHEIGALRVVCDSDPEREALVKERCPGVGFQFSRQVVSNDGEPIALASRTAATSNLLASRWSGASARALWPDRCIHTDGNCS